MASDGTDDTDESDAVGDGDDTGRRDADERSGFTPADSEAEPASFVWGAEVDDERNDSDERRERTKTAGESETRETAETDDLGGNGTDPPDPPLDGSIPDRPSDASSAVSRTLDPERYLFAGETIVERVDVRRGWVAATSHRLLVFDPEASGTRFVTVERPNVLEVRTTGGGSRRIRSYAVRAGLYAAVLLAGGAVARGLGLRSLFATSPDVGSTLGVGGLVSVLSLVGVLVGLLVDLLVVGGLAAGVAGVALGVWYVRGRQPTLVVERAGETHITLELPSDAIGRRLVDAIEQAFREELAFDRG